MGGTRTARFAAFVLLLGACTAKGGATTLTHKAKTPVEKAFPALALAVTGDAPAAVIDGVHTALDQYLAAAVVTALRTGRAGPVADVFTADAAPGLTAADRATLVDEGLAGVVRVRPGAMTATVTSLGDEVAATKLDTTVTAVVGATPVTIHRTGDLVLVRDGTIWRIDGYDLKVTRDSVDPVVPSTSTTASTLGSGHP